MARGRPRKKTDDVLLKSAELLGWALGGLEREITQTRERLTALTAEAGKLRTRLGSAASGSTKAGTATVEGAAAPKAAKRRRNMSPEGRKKISDMMKKRWADRRKKMAKG